MSQLTIMTNTLPLILSVLLGATSCITTTMSFVNNNGGRSTTESINLVNSTNTEYENILNPNPQQYDEVQLTLMRTIATTIQNYSGKTGFLQAITILNSVFSLLAILFIQLAKRIQQQLELQNKELTLNNEILTEQFAVQSTRSPQQLDTILTVSNSPTNLDETQGTHYPTPIVLTNRNEPINTYI